VLSTFAEGRPVSDPAERTVVAPLRPGTRLIEIVRALDAAGVEAVDIRRREATLDDVFLTLTGAAPAEVAA
jgi:ABC-2 type transport system ATP-binding protein